VKGGVEAIRDVLAPAERVIVVMLELAVGWARLSRRGEPKTSLPREVAGRVPGAVADLVATHGVGWLCGFFEVVAPLGAEWGEWQARARLLRSRGYFAGIEDARFDTLVVFARDVHGHALAMARGADGEECFYLLTCA
jgi:hypothetical protein